MTYILLRTKRKIYHRQLDSMAWLLSISPELFAPLDPSSTSLYYFLLLKCSEILPENAVSVHRKLFFWIYALIGSFPSFQSPLNCHTFSETFMDYTIKIRLAYFTRLCSTTPFCLCPSNVLSFCIVILSHVLYTCLYWFYLKRL